MTNQLSSQCAAVWWQGTLAEAPVGGHWGGRGSLPLQSDNNRDQDVRGKGKETHTESRFVCCVCLHLLCEQWRQDVRSWGECCTGESPGDPAVWKLSPACCLRCPTPAHTQWHYLSLIGHCNTKDACLALSQQDNIVGKFSMHCLTRSNYSLC